MNSSLTGCDAQNCRTRPVGRSDNRVDPDANARDLDAIVRHTNANRRFLRGEAGGEKDQHCGLNGRYEADRAAGQEHAEKLSTRTGALLPQHESPAGPKCAGRYLVRLK